MSDRVEGPPIERRAADRESANQSAYILYQNRRLECEILDISSVGARIQLADTQDLPKFFELHTPDGAAYLCEMKRRKSDHIGVRFLRQT